MLQAPLSGARCMHRGRQYRCPAHDASRSNCIARARPSGRQWCQLGLPIYTVARCRARTQAFSSLTSEVQGDDSSHIDTADNVTQAEGAQTNGAAVAWDNTTTPTEDWSESKAFTLKDLDWGLTSLLALILLLSFGAFRILNYFRLYSHDQQAARASQQQQTAMIVDRTRAKHKTKAGKTSRATSQEAAVAADKQQAGSLSREAVAGVAAHLEDLEAAELRAQQHQHQQQQHQQQSQQGSPSSPPSSSAPAAGVDQQPGGTGAVPAGLQGAPGSPQPSPLDEGFSKAHAPWAGTDLGALSLAPLKLQEGGTPDIPPLPSIQADLPSKAVDMAEVEALTATDDISVPAMRERAHIAMKASAAAMEASQRASAYSAAASSAASRAAEAAEHSASAAASVQSALETAAEDAMAAAVARMNKAVEMVADAESRAATAAAMATAYQDIAEGQSAVASKVADLPAQPQHKQAVIHDGMSVQDRFHAHMFNAWSIMQDWAAGLLAGIVSLVAGVQAALAAAWSAILAWLAAVVAFITKPFRGG
eukprot:jgi/Chrzof1/7514/Cz02g26170.t1